MKSAVLMSVLALTMFAVWEESALARNYLNCLSKKVVIVDAPKRTTSSSAEENFGFWIDEATKVVTLADVRRFDDSLISVVLFKLYIISGTPKGPLAMQTRIVCRCCAPRPTRSPETG